MLRPKKSGINYSRTGTISNYSEPRTGRVSATLKDSVIPQLQESIEASEEKAINTKKASKKAGKDAVDVAVKKK